MVSFSAATFKMSPFGPNTENQRRAGETESTQTSEDTSEVREGFPLEDDTVIRHNKLSQWYGSTVPIPPSAVCVCVCTVVCACVKTHICRSLCTQAWSHGISLVIKLNFSGRKRTFFTFFTWVKVATQQCEILPYKSCIQNLTQVKVQSIIIDMCI